MLKLHFTLCALLNKDKLERIIVLFMNILLILIYVFILLLFSLYCIIDIYFLNVSLISINLFFMSECVE